MKSKRLTKEGISSGILVIDMLVILAIGWVFARTMRRMGNVTGLAILHAVINVLGG